jgi:methionine synthase I (cobalamin-dependent)
MNLSTFLTNQEIILLDGAMGTRLDERGLMSRGRNNLDAPKAVLEIHREYARCGQCVGQAPPLPQGLDKK